MLLFYVQQEKLLGELSLDMETTSNRLDFVQVCIVSLAIAKDFISLPLPYPLVKMCVFTTYYCNEHE
jgi:hypothetical protein